MSQLPPGWLRARLGDLGNWTGGGTPSKSRADFWTGGTIPWVSPKDMKVEVVQSAEDAITENAVTKSATSIVPAGAVLIVVRSGILRHTLPVATTAVPVSLNQDLKALSPVQGVLAKYVAWALRHFEQEILHSCTKAGTTVQSVEFPRLLNFEIPLAPFREQARIVAAIEEHLSELDAAVLGVKRVKAQLRDYRTAVLRGASDGSTTGEDPLLWPVQMLGGVLTSLRNGIPTKPTAQFGQAILRISSVRAMSVDLKDVRYLDPDAGWRSYQLADNDLLFTRYNGNAALVGACGRVRGLKDSLVHPDKLIRGTVDVSRVDPAYLEIALNSGQSRAFIRSHVKTSAGQAGISGHDLKRTPVRLPPLDMQRRIVADAEQRLSIVEAIEKAVHEALVRSVGLRHQILRRAFDGRLVQQDFNDEPGQALIQRSRAERAPVSRGERARRPVKLR